VTWSGDVGNNPVSKSVYFGRAVRSAEMSWEGVARAVEFIRSVNPGIAVNLVTHSLGSVVALEMAKHGVKFDTVIMLVPAIDNESLSIGGKYEKALQNINRLVVVSSDNQGFVFGTAYRAGRFDRALGYTGPTGFVPHHKAAFIDGTASNRNAFGVNINNHSDIYDRETINMISQYLEIRKRGVR